MAESNGVSERTWTDAFVEEPLGCGCVMILALLILSGALVELVRVLVYGR